MTYHIEPQYNANALPYKARLRLLLRAHKVCYNWWFDTLDCSVSFARQVVPNITFREAMKRCKPDTYITVIFRKSICRAYKDHYEFGFRCMTTPDYFLWIEVTPDKGDTLVRGLPRLI